MKPVTYTILLIFVFSGCERFFSPQDQTETPVVLSELEMPADFDFSTKKATQFWLVTRDNRNNPLRNVKLTVFGLEGSGLEKELFSGLSDFSGVFEREVEIPANLEQVVIKNDYIGLVNELIVPIDGDLVEVDYGNLSSSILSRNFGQDIQRSDTPLAKSATAADYRYLGSYSSSGVPDYLVSPGDAIDQDFLNDVNTSLPERAPVPDAHPEYLAEGNQINTLLFEPADVWVTFIHEGAGYKNVLGFYSYPSESPPATTADIDSVTIIFPNVSFAGSGGGLYSGDKVCLGHFPAGTEIGWVLFSDGWKSGGVTAGRRQVYSEPSFNTESDPVYRQHNVLLYDAARDLTVLGFEDLDRTPGWGSDDDFNDALFYVTSNPTTAIEIDSVTTITYSGNDTDGDGVNDPVDDYPDDPSKAYDNYYPAENIYGCLAFEDLWPNQGDYDFNDLVVDYYFTEIMNADNLVVQFESRFVLKAIGASFENGFGFELGVAPAFVDSVSGSNISGSTVALAANGVEVGQDQAVVIVFDNAYSQLSRPEGFYVNTQPDAPYIYPDTVVVSVVFTEPLDPEILGTPPYNPFIFINQIREREVHLAGKPPTSIAEGSAYFDSGDDASSESGYYKTTNNLPWALDIVEPLAYPLERSMINSAHNHFVGWAQTSGNDFSDWYKNNAGYRNQENIYSAE